MARSSTTFLSKWRNGKTAVIRVPEVLTAQVLKYAMDLDGHGFALETPSHYRTATNYDLTEPINVAAVPQRSPFRYPGGKTWLVPYIRTWLSSLSPKPAILIEPFAGGGIVGLTAAFEHMADHVVLVEKDAEVAAVWMATLGGQAEWIAKRIEGFELTRRNVEDILSKQPKTLREKAFATILRNRVQRGGIMAAGAGLVKYGENGRGLSSRWYPCTLSKRLRTIALNRHRLSFFLGDGLETIEAYADEENAVFFVDPPYTKAARRLYTHWQIDHCGLFSLLKDVRGNVLLTYDHSPEIVALARKFGFETLVISMKNTHHAKKTELLVGKDLSWVRSAQVSRGSTVRTDQAALGFHP